MPWIHLLLAVGAFAVALRTTSMTLLVICLLAALGFAVAGFLGLLAQRVGSRTRDESSMLDPAELKRQRERIEARKAEDAERKAAARRNDIGFYG